MFYFLLFFRESLGLKSVERSMVLLKPDLLVVVDTVYFKSDSKVKKMSSYFQNVMQPFKAYKHRSYNGKFSFTFSEKFYINKNVYTMNFYATYKNSI